jgi:hypothetical protein
MVRVVNSKTLRPCSLQLPMKVITRCVYKEPRADCVPKLIFRQIA